MVFARVLRLLSWHLAKDCGTQRLLDRANSSICLQEPRKECSPTRGLGSSHVSLVLYLGDAPGVVGTWKNLFGKFMFWPNFVAPVVMRIRKSSRSTKSLSWKHEPPPTRIPSQRLQMMEPKLKPDSWHWSSYNKIDLFKKLDPNVHACGKGPSGLGKNQVAPFKHSCFNSISI